MTKIIYLGPSKSVRLKDGSNAVRGEPVDVDKDLAGELLEQSGAFERAKTVKKAATKSEKKE